MKFRFGFNWEPVMIAEVIRLGMLALVSFGLTLTTEQQVTILALVSALLAVVTRQNVTSQDTLHDAGLTQKSVVKMAAENTGEKPL